ncbi:protein crumbs homolog 1 isoform X2 [Polypterus senegalus]
MAVLKSSPVKLSFATYLALLPFIFIESVFCTEGISSCLSHPCQNNATCQDVKPDFHCQCSSISVAKKIKPCTPHNLCRSDSCNRNVTCITLGNPSNLMCRCESGNQEELCKAHILQCAEDLCDSGVSCQILSNQDVVPNYRCICQDGYEGEHCETNVNECASNPCHNGAVCRDSVNGYSCYCVPGFQGKHCEIEVNECISWPCQNGATCLNKIGNYVCICMPGYTGRNCDLETDECWSSPCQNGASCQDHLNGFSCTCAAGFQGDLCEIDIDECRSQPCQNGGQCIDGINGYSCICTSRRYSGPHCEIFIAPCEVQPCLNNGTCEERGVDYTCNCWPGFTGRDCEMDINECSSSPCSTEGTCIELSWKEYYGIAPELPANFEYRNAVGYICRCHQGYTGTFCQEDINECSTSPCHNGGTCENTKGGFTCHCPQTFKDGLAFGGPTCQDVLIGCDGHGCQNGGTCIPLLRDDQHEYRCACVNGYSGSMCQLSTTFSFEASGYIHVGRPVEDKEVLSNITLSFRTVLPNALLCYQGDKDVFIKLELLRGTLHLTVQIKNELSSVLELPHNMNDGEWHSVNMVLGGRTATVAILDSSCVNECTEETVIDSHIGDVSLGFHNIFIGGLMVNQLSSITINGLHTKPYFIGCFQDVYVHSQLIIPSNLSQESALNLTLGCSTKDRCLSDPCNMRGRCVNLWQSYHCECYRPYEGPNCLQEYTVARFGSDSLPSFAQFTIDDSPGENVTISMFIRTRQLSGLLLVIQNQTCQYLKIWLENGKVKIQVNQLDTLVGGSFLNDGIFHLLNVKIDQTKMELFQLMEQQSLHISHFQICAGDTVYVGGLPEDIHVSQHGGYFKGCVQDLRMNSNRLEFYTIEAPIPTYTKRALMHVTQGCPGDNICMTNPCQNGGVCYSIWDDFTCSCPSSTSGQRCEDVRWCELMPCPSEAICLSFGRGFECIANATFASDSHPLIYRGNGKIQRNLTNVTLSFRTRKSWATLLYAEGGPSLIRISIQDSLLVFELHSNDSVSTTTLKSSTSVNDVKWHMVTLSMVEDMLLHSNWQMSIDGKINTISRSESTGNLNFLREDTDILLGGTGPDSQGDLVGCLSTVSIGGIPLPYLTSADIHITKPQQEQFVKVSTHTVIAGCSGEAVCASNPCRNGGTCEDLFNLFNCTCPGGWTGLMCEINIDECESNPCVHGNCSDKILFYECICIPGYTGRNCELEINECLNHQCKNGATCIDGINRYSCLCPRNSTGPFCETILRYELENDSPFYYPIPRYPKLPSSFCENDKRNYTCYNGGNCTKVSAEWKCACLPGFQGDWCEVDIDECASNPCLNEGHCRNMINKYQCFCGVNFAGNNCEVDLTADKLTSDLLLSICLVSVALLLVLFLAVTAVIIAMNRRATQGTYSPSRQEKEGSRVEMWNMVQPPPMERLI